MKIYHHPRLKESYERLPLAVKKKAERREAVFRKDPFDRRLGTHKLHGKLQDQWSFSIDKKYRILFEFNGADVTFLDAGSHDLYR